MKKPATCTSKGEHVLEKTDVVLAAKSNSLKFKDRISALMSMSANKMGSARGKFALRIPPAI